MNVLSTLSTIRLKILNYQPIVCLQDLKANSYGMCIISSIFQNFFNQISEFL